MEDQQRRKRKKERESVCVRVCMTECIHALNLTSYSVGFFFPVHALLTLHTQQILSAFEHKVHSCVAK